MTSFFFGTTWLIISVLMSKIINTFLLNIDQKYFMIARLFMTLILQIVQRFYKETRVFDKMSIAFLKTFNFQWGLTKYSEVQFSLIKCSVFENIECRGSREINVKIPCIK